MPIPFMGTVAIAQAGVRNYAYNLHDALAKKGVYTGTLSIMVAMKQEDQDQVATRIYTMCEQQDHVEEYFPREAATQEQIERTISEYLQNA